MYQIISYNSLDNNSSFCNLFYNAFIQWSIKFDKIKSIEKG